MRLCLSLAALLAILISGGATARGEEAERIVVTGSHDGYDDLMEEEGGYGQPEWVDRSRVSLTTKLYVLNPFEVFVGLRSETDFLHGRGTVADLRQELEIGLPYRLELDLENQVGFARRGTTDTGPSVGARYAFGNWDKVPLNPAIAASYQFGTGRRTADRFEPTGQRGKSDGFEVRLSLGQQVVPLVRWGANVFFERDTAAARDRQIGFAQDVACLVFLDRLEAGVEMRFTNATRHGEGRPAANEFVIGPSVSWTPRTATFLSVATLFGCTDSSPRVAILASVALEFGRGEAHAAPKPNGR